MKDVCEEDGGGAVPTSGLEVNSEANSALPNGTGGEVMSKALDHERLDVVISLERILVIEDMVVCAQVIMTGVIRGIIVCQDFRQNRQGGYDAFVVELGVKGWETAHDDRAYMRIAICGGVGRGGDRDSG